MVNLSNKKYQIKSSTDKKAGVVKAVSEDDKEIEFAFDGKSLITELDFGGKLVCDSMLFSFKIDQESQDYLTDTTEKHYLVDAFEAGGEYVMHDQKDSSKGGIFIVQINSKLKKEIYSTVVVDTKNNFYNLTNTKLEFADEDDDIESSNSTFKIVVENKTYVEIKGTGNYNPKHIILDNLKGEYHLASDLSKTLIINGDGTATYDGETYNYTFENKTVTLKKGLRTDVIELDLENKTYTVTSSVTESPSYIGLTFTAENRYEYEDDDDFGGYFVTVTCSISIKFIDANTCEMSWNEYDEEYGEETCIEEGTKFSYTLENNIVKITFKFKNSISKNIDKDNIVISKDKEIKKCIGCFGCWIKTPGECVIKDDYNKMGEKIASCDELVIVSECKYGMYSPFVKNVLDRSIGYIHPYFTIRNNEIHHKSRYKKQINMRVYFYGNNISDEEKEVAKELVNGNGINFNTKASETIFVKDILEIGGTL